MAIYTVFHVEFDGDDENHGGEALKVKIERFCFTKKIQEVTCKLQAYISVYQEGLENEFCVPSYNSDLTEMIEERAGDGRVKKSLEPWS